MRNLLLLLLVVCKLDFAVAQDSADYYINHLSWNSLIMKPTYGTQIGLDGEAMKLIEYKNKSTVKKLLCAITNDNKTVAVHMILSKMFESPEMSPSWKNIYTNDSSNTVEYTYNGLTWKLNGKTREYKITPASVKRIKEYWEGKLLDQKGRVLL